MNRNLDNLGRIVIPKEMRDALKLKNGDEVNIKIDNETIIITNPSKTDDFGNWLRNRIEIEEQNNAVYTSSVLKEVMNKYIDLK